jgi:hypothetical protein
MLAAMSEEARTMAEWKDEGLKLVAKKSISSIRKNLSLTLS